MARDTNFYYSFLVLTAGEAAGDHRCLGLLPRRRRCGRRGRRAWRRCRRGRALAAGGCGLLRGPGAADSTGPRAGAAHQGVRPHAAAVRVSHRGRRDGSRDAPLRDLRRSLSVLHPRRIGRRLDVPGDFRLPQSCVAAIRHRSRRRSAADEHPARRPGRPRARTHLHSARGSPSARLLGRGLAAGGGERRRRRPVCECPGAAAAAGRACPGLLRSRRPGVAARGCAAARRRRDHGRHLPWRARRHRAAQLRRLHRGRAHPAAAARGHCRWRPGFARSSRRVSRVPHAAPR